VGLLSLGTGNNALFSKVTPGYMPEPFKDVKFFRVYFDDLDTAHNIVITMNALESKYEKGYVIVEVTTGEEYDLLLSTGLKIEEIPDPMADKIAEMREATLVQTSGIPGYPCYRTVEETFATAASIAANYPGLATWTDQGDSWEKTNGSDGYDLHVLKLTNTTVAGPKSKLFLTGAIHAREYTTAELLTRLAEYLVDKYDTDPDVTWMLDYHEIHMMLHANPDGRKQAETGILWRKNTNRNYCGTTSDLRGADLNRNFEFEWNSSSGSSGNPCSVNYRGPYAASEPETQAIQNYIRSQFPDQRGPNNTDPAPFDTTGIYLDMHSHGREVRYQSHWLRAPVGPVPNVTELITLARKIAYFSGHRVYGTDLEGTSKLFGYGEMGIPAYTVELGTEFFEDCTYFENTLVPDNIPALLYALKVARTPYMTSAGPDAVNPAVSFGSTPPGIPAGTSVILTASVDDTRYNGSEPWQNIAAAQYYVDVPPWVSTPGPFAYDMSPKDGNFNSPVEAVEATINTTGWSEGRHIIFVRGQDADGNQGAFSAVFLYINNSGGNPPAAPANLTANPISCNQIYLAWTDNSYNEDGFRIYRGDTSLTLIPITTVGANTTYYQDSELTRKTVYYYKVCAYNTNGEGCSATIQYRQKQTRRPRNPGKLAGK
jgi:predicted deacylase